MSSLIRSTKYVRYFIGAPRTHKLNSANTAEQNLLTHSKTLSKQNNILSREYAVAKNAESIEPLLQRLDLEVKRYGRIAKKDIDDVFDEIKGKNHITSSQSLLVIRCCGDLIPEELPEQRTQMVQKIWNLLTDRGIPMDISHYNALLRVYLENEHPFSPSQFLEELESKGLQPNRVTYQRLIRRYCQEGNLDGATGILEKMRELNMAVSEPVLNALVMGYSSHGDIKGAKAVIETMSAAGLLPSNQTYALLACGYAKKGDMQGIEDVIKIAKEKDEVLTDEDILSVIEQLAYHGHEDKVESLFVHLQKGVGYNQEVCKLILKLLNKGLESTAKKLMKTMPLTQKSEEEDNISYRGTFFIKHLLRLNKPVDEVITICKNLQEENLAPDALYIATEAALIYGNNELAQKLFKELQKQGIDIRQHYYWPLLAQKGKENDEEGMLQILKDMTNEGMAPIGETLRLYVIPYLIKNNAPQNLIEKLKFANVSAIVSARNVLICLLNAGKLKEAAEIALDYKLTGHFNLLSRPLLQALRKTNDIESFVNILHVTSSSRPALDETGSNEDIQENMSTSVQVGRIVLSAVKHLKTTDLIEKLLESLYSKGIGINSNSAEQIEQYIGQNLTNNLSELLTKLTSSDLQLSQLETPQRDSSPRTTSAQLKPFLESMKKRGNNVNGIQKQLLMAYLKENNLEMVESFLKELESSNFEPNSAILGQLYEFYCQNDLIEKAEECKAQIAKLNPEFTLNNLKTISMAFALIRADRYNEALKLLSDYDAEKDISNEGSMYKYKSRCRQMLDYLAEKKETSKVKEITDLLIEKKLAEPSNLLLGASIKVHLLQDDLEGALKEYENCCKKYSSTPWKSELMKALIMNEDGSKLQWLADISTQVLGEVKILNDLALAFIECGKLRQARRIFETKGMQTRWNNLDYACQRYNENGKSEHLESLLEATKDLSYIDRSEIFYHLLVTYCKAGETDKAFDLWTLVQEEGEVPSEKFLAYLGKHLKENKREVPFVIPGEPIPVTKTVSDPSSKSKPRTGTNKHVDLIENLMQNGKASEALDQVQKMMSQNITLPERLIRRVLDRLALDGNIEKIEQFGEKISLDIKQKISFYSKLTQAKFVRGQATPHIDELLSDVTTASNNEQLFNAVRKFPTNTALESILSNEDCLNKCLKIADIAATKANNKFPANILWIEFMVAGKMNEADSVWDKYLKNHSPILFSRLISESHSRKQPEIINNLIEKLESNPNVSKSAVGNAYSRLINYYLSEENPKKAKATLERAIKNGVASDLNKNCSKRVIEACEKSDLK